MSRRVEAAVGSDEHMVPKGHRGAVQNDAVVVDLDLGAHADVATVVAPEHGLDGDVIPRLAQQLPQQPRSGLRVLHSLLIEPAAQLLGPPSGLDQLRCARPVQRSGQHFLPFRHGFPSSPAARIRSAAC